MRRSNSLKEKHCDTCVGLFLLSALRARVDAYTGKPVTSVTSVTLNHRLRGQSTCKFNSCAQKKTLPPSFTETVDHLRSYPPPGGRDEVRALRPEIGGEQNLSQSQIKILKYSMWFRSARLQIDVLRCPICKIGPRGARPQNLRPRCGKSAGTLSCPNRPEFSFLVCA